MVSHHLIHTINTSYMNDYFILHYAPSKNIDINNKLTTSCETAFFFFLIVIIR